MEQAARFKPTPRPIPELYQHQKDSVGFYDAHEHVFNASDAGTGKTAAWLHWFAKQRAAGGPRALVIATSSILEAAWVADARTFTPELKIELSLAGKRQQPFLGDADVVITNHDAVREIAKKGFTIPKDFEILNIDESTAFKNPQSQRSKAARELAERFSHRTTMSGTPSPQGVLDLWHQALLCDGGERLGKSFYAFRQTVCEPEKVAPHLPHVKWVEKPGSLEAVADILSDITIRYKLEEVLDMPPLIERYVPFTPPAAVLRQYQIMRKHHLMELEGGLITTFNAATVAQKLLQLTSGAVYDESGEAKVLDNSRNSFVLDLVEEREHTLVAFNWDHQKVGLIAEAERRKLPYAVIDGSVPMSERSELVAKYQDGQYRVLFAHPRTAAHGLTLTRGEATIWASPTFSTELWHQFNRRVYRAGQTKRCEILKVIAHGTREEDAYNALESRVSNMDLLLALME